MKLHGKKVAALVAGAAALSALAAAAAYANAITGPSSSESPYVVRSRPGVVTKSILTVGDTVPKRGGGSFRMVGLPDGLGAFDNGNGTFTLLSNHELGNAAGLPRAHDAAGAFVSRWTIDKDSLKVRSGSDLIEQISTWNAATSSYNAPAKGVALNRLCSADLARISAFYNFRTGNGFRGRLFTDGEESGSGRAFAHTLDGTSYELPAMGKYAFENVVPRPRSGDATVVAAQDDTTPGQVYIYKGAKTAAGNPAERAGLANGTLYGVKVQGVGDESREAGIASGTHFSLASLGDVRNKTAAEVESASAAAGVTRFLRPEDGSWDPTNPNAYYFVTTDRFNSATQTGRSRLWRLNFADGTHPERGGTIDMLLDGTEGQEMLDNITVNRRGQVLAQEDPGGQDHLARLWIYSPKADVLTEIAHHAPERFLPGAPAFLTNDEESSGIIDASRIIGRGWYLFDVQAHYAIPGELVEGGQYLALHLPPGKYPR
jgi:Bacterial protein of unknown function (DUF839)